MLDSVHYNRPDSHLTDIGLASALGRNDTGKQIDVCFGCGRDLPDGNAKQF